MKKKNIVFYFEDKSGFGHICGLDFFFNALKKEHNILLFFSGDYRKHVLLNGVKTIHLPFSEKNEKHIKRQKIALIASTLRNFKPDIFMMDYYPFWKFQMRQEMREIISQTKWNNGKVYCFMRDIHTGIKWLSQEEYQYHSESFRKVFGVSAHEQMLRDEEQVLRVLAHNLEWQFFRVNLFLEHYLSHGYIDNILVFWDKNIHNLSHEFNLSQELKDKFIHIGYIVDSIGRRYKVPRGESKKIIVSSWGNVTSEKQFLQLLINVQKLSGYKVDVFLWDFLRPEYRKLIETHFAQFENITISGFVSHFREILHNYDFYFGFGGYGTFLDLLYEGIPAGIIPNFDSTIFADRKLEQENRVKLLKGKVNMIGLKDTSYNTLLDFISSQYKDVSWGLYIASPEEVKEIIFS